MNGSFFSLAKAREMMFYAGTGSDEYMRLSLGKRVIEVPFDYQKSGDDEIDERLRQIKHHLSFIDDIPFFLDLNENRITSVACRRSEASFFFNKILTELAYKHHYHDLNIAIFSLKQDLASEIYNLPHLFIKGKRMLISSARRLQELDRMKLERPLVLMMKDSCECQFTNRNIYVIYFSDDIHDIFKNSDAVIDYRNYNACLYRDGATRFVCYQEDIDFNSHYMHLGKYTGRERKGEMSFSSVFSNFDIRESYLSGHTDLKADFAYCDGEIMSFDLHESRQGPHGLIGGSTGSGKSELIISMLLSMCIRYSPRYLNIVLVDYKGGGIIGSLSERKRTLPHVIASITNLENNVLDRLVISLKNECQRRQRLFRQVSQITDRPIMDIDDYLESISGYDIEPLAHLLVVVDEFAELKKEHSEQIRELISISRIGRSLGLHLILATQKPSGNIDDEIWSNSRFKISLKLFEEKDSLDIIRTKDAAYLNGPGEFLMRVDDTLTHAISLYSRKDINGNDPYAISLLDESLETVKQKTILNREQMTEASYYVRRIFEICDSLGMYPDRLDFLPPASERRKDIRISDCFVLGVKDDYINGYRDVLHYSIKENILLYSSRKKEINMILNTLEENGRQTVVISHDEYRNACLNDSLRYEDTDDIRYLFMVLDREDPEVTVVIEDLGVMLSHDDDHLDLLCRMIRKSRNSSYSFVCLTGTSQLSFRLISSFSNRVMIGISERSDLSCFYSSYSRYKGSNYYADEEPVTFVPVLLEERENRKPSVKKLVIRIPEHIGPHRKDDSFLLGYDLESRKKVFGDRGIKVFSYDRSLLKRYEKAYGMDAVVYDHKGISDVSDDYLWLGPGVFSQRLFVPLSGHDLKKNEGMLFRDGRRMHVRIIDE
ncbi:MAG: hypothetical protein IKX97_02190 [Erysipelotrichaceae bacterium]|nr:hypothetical protein [Erysipelotrichaceae bacterium]